MLVSLLAALAVIGGYWLAYVSHCFLSILEQTAAGNRRIEWTDEVFHDWLWKVFYLGWLAAAWVVLGWLIHTRHELLAAGRSRLPACLPDQLAVFP